jgi:hypothetical protein
MQYLKHLAIFFRCQAAFEHPFEAELTKVLVLGTMITLQELENAVLEIVPAQFVCQWS